MAIWLAINGLINKRRLRIIGKFADVVVVGLILALGAVWMTKMDTPPATAINPAPPQPNLMPKAEPARQQPTSALRVTGYTLYQQTVGEPLRLAIRVVNDGNVTIITSGASAIGVFDSNDNIKPLELQEKVFHAAHQKFEELKKAGALNKLEIPPKAQMHFDIDTKPKFLTQEMLDSIANDSIRVYFAGLIRYKDINGAEQFIPYCAFTDAKTRSIPNCNRHNAPYGVSRK
jgi:hypothetical protein